MTSINSPFRYAGGKFYARKLILKYLPQHTNYTEIFAGGGSIFFAKDKAETNTLNDLDQELINTYTQIRDHVEGLIGLLDGWEATKENHTYFKNEYIPTNELEKAFRWYFLNRTSYSGIMNMTNCYFGYGPKYSMQPQNWPKHLRRCSQKLQGVNLTCTDFTNAIENVPDGAFLFLDPPYFNADQDKFYTHSFTSSDHTRLAKVLKEHSGRLDFMLTYDNCSEVRQLYDWCELILEQEWTYTIARTDDQTSKGKKKKLAEKGKRSSGREIFIFNYQPVCCSPGSLQQGTLF